MKSFFGNEKLSINAGRDKHIAANGIIKCLHIDETLKSLYENGGSLCQQNS